MATPGAAPRRAAVRRVPAFALYGESGQADAQLLHIEAIAARGAQYRWEIGAHLHPGLCQAVWVQTGAVRVSLDERQATLAAPAAIVLPPGVVHAFRFSPGTQGWVLSFSPRRLLEGEAAPVAAQVEALFERPVLLNLATSPGTDVNTPDDAALRTPGARPAVAGSRPADAATAGAAGPDAAPASPDATRLAELLRTLLREFEDSAGLSPTVAWLARSVVWHLARCAHRHRVQAPRLPHLHAPLYTRFVRLVEQNHAAHWPMTRYARTLGLSLNRLNRLTQEQAGCQALKIVHERLLLEAQRQLRYTDLPVSRIGFALGFEDPAYFARFFRRLTGQSPAQWRQDGEAGG